MSFKKVFEKDPQAAMLKKKIDESPTVLKHQFDGEEDEDSHQN